MAKSAKIFSSFTTAATLKNLNNFTYFCLKTRVGGGGGKCHTTPFPLVLLGGCYGTAFNLLHGTDSLSQTKSFGKQIYSI